MTTSTPGTLTSQKAEKKPYRVPLLVRYGDVRALTQSGSGTPPENPAASGPGCTPQSTRKPCVSDRRAKANIVKVGEHPLGFGFYLFDYKLAYQEQYGTARQFGVMADEVEKVVPAAIESRPDGIKTVDYTALGINLSPR
jgi:hypothetical protein